jgi:hypothetical protein
VKLADAVRLAKSVKVSHAQSFARHVVPEVVRPARVIWNQAIGGIFLLFAISFLGYAVSHRESPAGVAGGVFLGLIMGFFAATSFLSARKISRR